MRILNGARWADIKESLFLLRRTRRLLLHNLPCLSADLLFCTGRGRPNTFLLIYTMWELKLGTRQRTKIQKWVSEDLVSFDAILGSRVNNGNTEKFGDFAYCCRRVELGNLPLRGGLFCPCNWMSPELNLWSSNWRDPRQEKNPTDSSRAEGIKNVTPS